MDRLHDFSLNTIRRTLQRCRGFTHTSALPFSGCGPESTGRYYQVGAVERARQWRSVLAGRNFSDLAADIQTDRNR